MQFELGGVTVEGSRGSWLIETRRWSAYLGRDSVGGFEVRRERGAVHIWALRRHLIVERWRRPIAPVIPPR